MPSKPTTAQPISRRLDQDPIKRLLRKIIEEVHHIGKPSEASLGHHAYYCRYHPEYYIILQHFLRY
jgi:hypothetical protein